MEEIRAAGTKADYPFFHSHFRSVDGEGKKLTVAQWLEIADRHDRALGLVGQPGAASLHINKKTGDMHLHLARSLVAENEHGRVHVKKLGLYKNKLKRLSREIEKDFGLTIISSERQPGDRARPADRNEFEESRRLGTDLKAIRNAILDCFEKSDNGKSFAAAIKAHGFEVAPGDRRDTYLVIDHAGGHHALNKQLTGKPLAEIRTRLADLDRSQLPSVDQAKEMQAERQAARAAQEREKHAGAGIAAGQGTTRPDRPQPELKPLGKTAGEIRLAWSLSRSADEFARGIEQRGLILVNVSREEAEASHRAHDFAKALGRQNRVLKEGFAVVDQRGTVTRIDQRTTGDQWEEIQKRLGGIDPASLSSVADARAAMKEANRAAWAEQQQCERPATAIEATIADALKATMTGPEFAQALDEAGLTVTRATDADRQALDALRRDQQLAAATGLEAAGRHFPALETGDLAAVTKSGDVFRLNPGQLDFAEIEQRLLDVQPRLASVTEGRAAFELNREHIASLWTEIKAENTEARVASAEAKQAGRDIRSAAATVQHEKQELAETAAQTVEKGTRVLGGLLGRLAHGVESFIAYLGDFLSPPPPPTQDQAERMVQVAEEKQEQAAWSRSAEEQEAAFQALQEQMARDSAEKRRVVRERGDSDWERDRP